MATPRFLIPLLYSVIFLAAAVTGFIYTNNYSGWGHYYANAVPVGFGLGTVATFVAAILVSQMSERPTQRTLLAFALFWLLFATLLIVFSPDNQ